MAFDYNIVNSKVIVNGNEVTIGKTQSQINIERYKQVDINRIMQQGGELATDEEYEQAEIEMQQIYSDIMEDKE